MGGDIGVQSRIGQGSVFRLDIPVQPPLSSHASNTDAPANDTAPALGSVPGAEKGELEIRNNLSTLRALIAEDDIRAVSLWHQHIGQFQPLLGAASARLEHELTTYNFEAALAALDSALASVPPSTDARQ
jgi:hypothetical protein